MSWGSAIFAAVGLLLVSPLVVAALRWFSRTRLFRSLYGE